MAITPTDVTRAFSVVSGSTNLLNSDLTVTYIKNTNTIPADIPMTVANSSGDFYIKVVPLTSNSLLQVYRSGSTALVNENNPIIIPPTGSKELVLRLTQTLEENWKVETRPESIIFSLVAMIPGTTTTSNTTSDATGSTSGATGGGSGGAEPTSAQNDSTLPSPSSQF